MRAPNREIAAPPFPSKLTWVNVASLRMDQQIGRPVLVEFWDFCRPNSLRTLPYLQAWHDRYQPLGLRVIGVHTAGFAPSTDPEAVRAAVARLEITYPVVVDENQQIWELYGNLGWPARYLFDQEGLLFDFHYGEGAYVESELAIRELLSIPEDDEPPLVEAIRPEDAPDAELLAQSDDVAGPYSGPYEAGAVWAVLDGDGFVEVDGLTVPVTHPGAYPLKDHSRHTAGVLDLQVGDGVVCHAVIFTPGVRE